MLRKIFFLLAVFICVQTEKTHAQDAEFSQFFSAPLYLNPALAGTAYSPRVTINYRNQWPSLDHDFITYSVGYDQHIDVLHGGIGVLVSADQIGRGLMSTNSVYGMYSFNLKLGNNFGAKAALQAGYVQKTIDWSQMTFYDMIDPVFGFTTSTGTPNPTNEPLPVNDQISFPDFGAGLLAYSTKTYFGFGVKHLTQPYVSFTGSALTASGKLPLRFAAHFGSVFKISKNARGTSFFSPNIVYIHQLNFQQLNIGAYLQFGSIYTGLSFRHNISNKDAFILVIGVTKGIFRMGYSYDITVSKLGASTGGAHEVSLILNFGKDDNELNPGKWRNMTPCPEILNF